jgi:hypothetical protein
VAAAPLRGGLTQALEPTDMHVVHRTEFFHEGRGPELLSVHLAKGSSHLLAIDFRNPDSTQVRHLKFQQAQAYMFTPEEVENYARTPVDWGATDGGSLVSLGRSNWLDSFSPRHLSRCSHFRVMFYDEFLDVLCESVTVFDGAYASGL